MTTKRPTKKAPAKAGATSTRIDFYQDPAEYTRIVENQKKWIRGIAQTIEDGRPLELDMFDRKAVASVLRLWADNLPNKPKGRQGPPPKFCHGSEAMVYAAYRHHKGMRHGEALSSIADRVGVSETAVEKAIRKYRAAAFAFIGVPDPGNQ